MSLSTPSPPTAHVHFTSWEEFGGFLGQQGSARGLFMRAEMPPPIGTEIRVHFVLPDGSELTLAGRVVHSVNLLEARALDEEPGMGVQFTHMSEAQGRALQELMMKALSSPSLPPPGHPRRAAPAASPHPEPRQVDDDPRLHEASSLLDRLRFDAAEQKVAELLRERPTSFEGRVILFTVQARRAASEFDFATAIERYRSLLQLDPAHAEARAQLPLMQREAETSRALVERVFGSGKSRT